MTARMRGWRIGALAALLALIVRLAVPIGFMPAAGAAALIPCPAQTNMPALPQMHGMHHDAPAHHDHDGGRQSCPFAGVAAVADFAAPVIPLLLPPLAIALAILRPVAVSPGLGLAAPPPPKTGPPVLR